MVSCNCKFDMSLKNNIKDIIILSWVCDILFYFVHLAAESLHSLGCNVLKACLFMIFSSFYSAPTLLTSGTGARRIQLQVVILGLLHRLWKLQTKIKAATLRIYLWLGSWILTGKKKHSLSFCSSSSRIICLTSLAILPYNLVPIWSTLSSTRARRKDIYCQNARRFD